MALSGSNLELIAVTVVLIVIVLGIFLVVLRRLRSRRDQLLGELGSKPVLVQDRAFNRLAMARREADVLARTGTDTSRARELIAQSQGAFDNREYPRSYELAQSAHEALVNARGKVGSPASPIPSSSTPASWVSSSSPTPSAAPAPSAPPLARNRAESQFQLHVLDQELTAARRDRPKQSGTTEAATLQLQAQAAYDRGEYTEAFRLALRARRSLGGKVEALAASPRPAGSGAAPSATVDPAAAAEQVAAANRCPNCGYPTMASDTFCRGCGTPRTPSVCAACGAPRAPADAFCGRCGARYSA